MSKKIDLYIYFTEAGDKNLEEWLKKQLEEKFEFIDRQYGNRRTVTNMQFKETFNRPSKA